MNTAAPEWHVVSLQYSLIACEHTTYTNPPPVEFETAEARFRLADGILKCEMKTHFSAVEVARAAVEPRLRAWEADADLRRGVGELRFKFDRPEVIDLSPSLPGALRGYASGEASMTGTLSALRIRGSYPEGPPSHFRLIPDAQSLLDRYRFYCDGREPLQSMAYFCLTAIEVLSGGGTRAQHRSHALAEYRIERDVLDTMGELTSEHGDKSTGRKASAAKPLTDSERAWLEAAVKKLIWQIGTEKASRQPLRMSDLPPL